MNMLKKIILSLLVIGVSCNLNLSAMDTVDLSRHSKQIEDYIKEFGYDNEQDFQRCESPEPPEITFFSDSEDDSDCEDTMELVSDLSSSDSECNDVVDMEVEETSNLTVNDLNLDVSNQNSQDAQEQNLNSGSKTIKPILTIGDTTQQSDLEKALIVRNNEYFNNFIKKSLEEIKEPGSSNQRGTKRTHEVMENDNPSSSTDVQERPAKVARVLQKLEVEDCQNFWMLYFRKDENNFKALAVDKKDYEDIHLEGPMGLNAKTYFVFVKDGKKSRKSPEALFGRFADQFFRVYVPATGSDELNVAELPETIFAKFKREHPNLVCFMVIEAVILVVGVPIAILVGDLTMKGPRAFTELNAGLNAAGPTIEFVGNKVKEKVSSLINSEDDKNVDNTGEERLNERLSDIADANDKEIEENNKEDKKGKRKIIEDDDSSSEEDSDLK